MPAHGPPVRRLLFIVLAVVVAHALALWGVQQRVLSSASADASVQAPVLPPVNGRLVPALVPGQATGVSQAVGKTPQPAAPALEQSARKAAADLAPSQPKPAPADNAGTGVPLPRPGLPTASPAPALAAAQGSWVAPAASLSARDGPSGVASAGASPGTGPGNEPNSVNASATSSTASSNSNASASAAKVLGTPVARLQLPSSDADYLRNPQPEYPPLSRRLGEQGRVVVNVLIGTDGSAQKAEILSTSGFDRLDQAALSTVRAWRYVPGKRSGVPEAMWFAVPIQFVLQ